MPDDRGNPKAPCEQEIPKELKQVKAKTLGRLLTALCNSTVESFIDPKETGNASLDAKTITKLKKLAQEETLRIAKELISAGADVNEDVSVNKKNHVPSSPLIVASRRENLPLVKLLVCQGAKITPQVMQSAAGTKNYEILSYLLKKGGKAFYHGELDMPTHKWRQDFPDVLPMPDAILYYAESDPDTPQNQQALLSIKLLLSYYKKEELEQCSKNGELSKETIKCAKEELEKRKIKSRLTQETLEL